MQLFDSAALFCTFVFFCLLFSNKVKTTWLLGVSIGMGIGFLLHLIIDGARWQMVPAYAAITAALLVAGLKAKRFRGIQKSSLPWRIGRRIGSSTALLLIVSTALLSYAFPIFDIPQPRGKFPVGTTELHLIDETRPESYTSDVADSRELMVRVWYPAESTAGFERDSYWRQPTVRSRAVTQATPLPWFTFTHLGLIPTNSFWQAPISTSKSDYPVVLYSHGIGIGWASANTVLAEGLASQGYIVVGIEHSYIGSVSIFPDGRVVTFDEETSATMNQPPPQEIIDMQETFRSSSDWQEQVALYRKAMTVIPGLTEVSKALEVQVADQKFVVDELNGMQDVGTHWLASHFDLTHLGAIGMSLGGSAALESCSTDARFHAGVNLDGFHPNHIGLGLQSTPFLFINREDNLLFNTNYENSHSPSYSALISGVTHFNFFDFAIMSPLYQKLGVLGPVDGVYGLYMIEDHARTFFDKHLKGQEISDLAVTAGRYPEISFTQRNVE